MSFETIILLLQSFGYWTVGFFVVSILLGFAFAGDRWNFSARRLASMQMQRSKMEAELRELQQRQDWSVETPSAGKGAGDLIIDEDDLLPPVGAAGIIVDPGGKGKVDHRAMIETQFRGEPVEVDPEFGILYTSLPPVIDPVYLIRGLGPKAERSLNARGVFCFKQIANWSPGNVRAFSEALPEGYVAIERDRWIDQAKELGQIMVGSADAEDEVDHESKILTEFPQEPVRVDPDFGILYPGEPTLPDSLDRIEGLSSGMAANLAELGIRRYPQISSWSRHNLAQVASKLGIAKEEIIEQWWLPQARLLEWERQTASPEWGISKPTLSDYTAKLRRDYAGEPVGADIGLGIVYKSAPSKPDNLKQIQAIDEEMAATLNEMGIWRFRQIADWSEANIRAVAQRLRLSREVIHGQAWVAQAGRLVEKSRKMAAFAGESYRTDRYLGIVYYVAPLNADNLTEIQGVTPELAVALNREGVFTFKQIALWEPENLEAFAEKAGIGVGQIRYHGWCYQAEALHSKKYGVSV